MGSNVAGIEGAFDVPVEAGNEVVVEVAIAVGVEGGIEGGIEVAVEAGSSCLSSVFARNSCNAK
ncbi:MAG TPA: hypothetical protein VFC63_08515 [Blastocatellia bacterium]|nr:hypothetical protein [Blastocatellia bacterium]